MYLQSRTRRWLRVLRDARITLSGAIQQFETYAAYAHMPGVRQISVAVWRMWGGKTVPDVYIAVKDITESSAALVLTRSQRKHPDSGYCHDG